MAALRRAWPCSMGQLTTAVAGSERVRPGLYHPAMSMIGEYARLTPAELGRAIRDPDWALGFIEELIEGGSDERAGAGQPRCLDIDKAWDTLGFLLRRIEFPVDIVHGEEEIPGAEDWGYGPPRYLTPEQVRAAAAALGGLSSDVLVRDVTEAELAQADLYPNIAGEGLQWLKYVTHHYDALVPFFRAAAAAGDAMVVWLD